MYEDINELIDMNLKLICESQDSDFHVSHFLDSKGNKISLIHPAKSFAYKMEKERLISVQGEFANVEDFGWKIYKNGGWKKHLTTLEEQSNQQALYEKEKEQLEFEKTRTDLELAKKMLKEYPKTKWFARIAFIIALLLSFIEIYSYLSNLK